MFNNAKTPQHCELMTSHLRNRITADGAHFELRLHLIYLTNDVLHHWYVTHASSDCRGHSHESSPQEALAQLLTRFSTAHRYTPVGLMGIVYWARGDSLCVRPTLITTHTHTHRVFQKQQAAVGYRLP